MPLAFHLVAHFSKVRHPSLINFSPKIVPPKTSFFFSNTFLISCIEKACIFAKTNLSHLPLFPT